MCTVNKFRYVTSEIKFSLLITKLQRIIMLRFESQFYEYVGVTAKQMRHVRFDALESKIARFAKKPTIICKFM